MRRGGGRPWELPALAAGVVAVAAAALGIAVATAPQAGRQPATASAGTVDAARDPTAAANEDAEHRHHLGPATEVDLAPRVQRRLDRQLAAARRAVKGIETAADAMARGYRIATVDLPFLGVHYLRRAYLDLPFSPSRPTHLIFPSDAPDAPLVGLMYYIEHDGEPEGFAGPNDHWHRHLAACLSGGIMIALDDITDELCAEMGGVMTPLPAEYERRWMLHVWAVPGIENPWGMFADGSPALA